MRPFPIAPRAVLMLVLVLGLPAAVIAAGAADPALTDTYDIRFFGGAARDRVVKAYESPRLTKAKAAARDRLAALDKAADRLRAEAPGVRMERDPMSGGMEVVTSIGSPLTAAEPGLDSASVVRGFLQDWREIYGLNPQQIENLEVLGESQQKEGPRTVRLRQTVHGHPVFQSDTRAVLDADGRLLSLVGRLVPEIDEDAVPATFDLDARAALRIAAKSVGPQPARLTRPATSELVYFPLSPGLVVPAWAQVLITRGPADWYTLVDARTGTLLWRKNIRWQAVGDEVPEVCFEVYAQDEKGTPADSPAPQTGADPEPERIKQRTLVKIVETGAVTSPSPEGWLDAATAPATIGNNVSAYLDLNGNDLPDSQEGPAKARRPRKADCLLFSAPSAPPPGQRRNSSKADPLDNPDAGDAPEDYRDGSVASLFYLVNWFHDQLFVLRFDEANGNFQEKNFRPNHHGRAGDRVQAEAQYGASANVFNLASFSAPPDGNPGILRVSLWNGPEPNRDGSLDAQLVIHELAHGVTSRMLCNGAGLNWYPGRALAEGWSDFYALALLNPSEMDDPDKGGAYSIGGYAAYKLGGNTDFTTNYKFGMRRFPYSTDMTVNPLTWEDADPTQTQLSPNGQSPLAWYRMGANDPHNAGELWALSLWEVRSRIIKATIDRGGTVEEGNRETLELVTKALHLAGCDPSFIQARDDLFRACGSTCPYEAKIWEGFRKRGLGYGASDSGQFATHYGIQESFDLPPAVDLEKVVVGNGDDFLETGKASLVTFMIRNPWYSSEADVVAELKCSPSNADISGQNPLSFKIKGGDTEDAQFQIRPKIAAGELLDCTLDITPQGQPTIQETPTLRVGNRVLGTTETCTCEPSTESSTEVCSCKPSSAAITDGDLTGRSFTFKTSKDLDVYSVELKIDDLKHTWVGDLTLMLRGPSGYGTDLIYRIPKRERITGLVLLGAHDGDDLKDTIITSNVNVGARDFYTEASDEIGKFTGYWAPALESRNSWLKPSDDQLGRFGGFYPAGSEWTLFVTDAVPGDKGDLNKWSLVFTLAKYE